MRILYLTSKYPFLPGEAFLSAEIRALQRLGATVLVTPCVRHTGTMHEETQALVAGHVVAVDPLSAWIRALARPAQLPALLSSPMRALVREHNKLALRGVLRASVASFVSERMQGQFDHIHAHWADTPSTVAMVASRLTGVPWSFTAHRGDIVLNNDLKAKVRSARFVRCISEASRQLVVARLDADSMHRSQLVVGHLGIEPAVAEAPITSESITLVCPAQLKSVKGHTYLISAAALLRKRSVPFRLVLCGEGPELQALESLVEEHSLNDVVEFRGHVSQVDLFALYTSGSVRAVVLPSVDLGHNLHEGLPVSLMEAMSHGLPVVSTTTGGIGELVDSAQVGTLVPPANVEALADALGDLLQNLTKAQEIGRAARAHVNAHWSAERSATELVDLITQGSA